MPVVQGRSWCYTLNNPSDEEIERLSTLNAVVHVAGREVGESGTPHLQGYIRFLQPCKLGYWKNQLPRAHVELRKGPEPAAIAYCKKDNNMLIEKLPEDTDVERPPKKGRFEYAELICDLIEQGTPISEIYKKHRGFYFYNRRAILQVKSDVARWKHDPDHVPDV